MPSLVISREEVDRAWEQFGARTEDRESFLKICKSQPELVGFTLDAGDEIHPSAADLLTTLTAVAIHVFESGPAQRLRKVKSRKIERFFGEASAGVRSAEARGNSWTIQTL